MASLRWTVSRRGTPRGGATTAEAARQASGHRRAEGEALEAAIEAQQVGRRRAGGPGAAARGVAHERRRHERVLPRDSCRPVTARRRARTLFARVSNVRARQPSSPTSRTAMRGGVPRMPRVRGRCGRRAARDRRADVLHPGATSRRRACTRPAGGCPAAHPHRCTRPAGGDDRGEPLRLAAGGSAERRLDHDLSIDLPGVASIRITAGATLDEQAQVLRRRRGTPRGAAPDLGAPTLADAERCTPSARMRPAASRSNVASGRPLQGATAKALAERILALREGLATQPPVDDPDIGIDPAAAQRDLAAADHALRGAEQAWQQASRDLIDRGGRRRSPRDRGAARRRGRDPPPIRARAGARHQRQMLNWSRLAETEAAERRAAAERIGPRRCPHRCRDRPPGA